MAGAQGDPQKWGMPGWRIEQRYSNKTLIGNWCEETKLFQRGQHSNSSTHRTDFKLYVDHKPDTIIRRSALMRNEGLRKQHLFTHHGNTYSNNMISWYDEQFNKRDREEGDKLPDLRKWDGHKLAWAPERSDYPMQGVPTNYGLHNKMSGRWTSELKAERQGHYITDYRKAYTQHPHTAFPHRFASAPKYLSSHFNPITKINKDLWLRRTPFNMAPEYPPRVTPPSAV
ncbi:cilia- and flagella-associated protein 107 [Ciona intestinalis]